MAGRGEEEGELAGFIRVVSQGARVDIPMEDDSRVFLTGIEGRGWGWGEGRGGGGGGGGF